MKSKSKKLDQFYTNPKIAKMCLNEIKPFISKNTKFIEPAAGSGSFSSLLKNVIAIDLDPKNKNIKKGDFLLQTHKSLFNRKVNSKNICVIGNPPFGKNSSLAIKFFNHASNLGELIAFIVPKTFRKNSVQSKLNLNFWLIKDIDLPKNSFIHNGLAHDTPCCFQIWIKKNTKREVLLKKESEFFKFVNKREADFAVRRVGGKSGTPILDFKNCATVSNYFIKSIKIKKDELFNLIQEIDFSKIVNSTAGVRSLSKPELINEVEKRLSL